MWPHNQGSPLREIVNARQIPGEPERRWFTSPDMDLIVWGAEGDGVTGFELCYDKQQNEHAILWSSRKGFSHLAVDDGEGRPGKPKGSPLLLADGRFDAPRVHGLLMRLRQELPPELSDFVLQVLEGHPNFHA